MVIDAGDNHQLSGSLNIGGTSGTSGALVINGPTGNQQAGFFRVGANSSDQKIGRMLLHDDGVQKVQLSGKGKSFITATNDGTHTTGARLGIETTDPKVELEVVGDISASRFIYGKTGTFKNLGHITASGGISSSKLITGEGLFISDDATITDKFFVGGNSQFGERLKVI